MGKQKSDLKYGAWPAGSAPVTVVLITFNEAHHLRDCLENLKGWAKCVYIVDSYSSDDTVSIALEFGAVIVQKEFSGFGNQWNFAIDNAPNSTPWVMKLDPDERLDEKLKSSLANIMCSPNGFRSIYVTRRLWFMERALPVKHSLIRAWRSGECRFSDVTVNEHPIVVGKSVHAEGELIHLDSPNLEHWLNKQNKYSSSEAINRANERKLSSKASLFGGSMERRMWLKKYFWQFPFRFHVLFLYHFFFLGAFRVGRTGYIWSKLRVFVYQLVEYKYQEIILTKGERMQIKSGKGNVDKRVKQYY